jgi:hypothetical protein
MNQVGEQKMKTSLPVLRDTKKGSLQFCFDHEHHFFTLLLTSQMLLFDF